MLTVRNCQEGKYLYGVVMTALYGVVNIANREVKWVVFIVSCSHQHGRLVTSQDNRDKHRPVRHGILGYEILAMCPSE